MIHTASLVHDDVLDDCDTRRGALAWQLFEACLVWYYGVIVPALFTYEGEALCSSDQL